MNEKEILFDELKKNMGEKMYIEIINKETLDPELIINSEDIKGFQYDPEDYNDKYKIYTNLEKTEYISVSRECYIKVINEWKKIKGE